MYAVYRGLDTEDLRRPHWTLVLILLLLLLLLLLLRTWDRGHAEPENDGPK